MLAFLEFLSFLRKITDIKPIMPNINNKSYPIIVPPVVSYTPVVSFITTTSSYLVSKQLKN